MKVHPAWAKTLALVGTPLVWLPLLAPALFALRAYFSQGEFLFDYLMPAELGLVVGAGGLLLVAAAFLVHRHRRLVSISLVAAFASLLMGLWSAQLTGLASGAVEAVGWPWRLLIFFLAGYWAGLIALGVGGILLLRDLFTPLRPLAA